MLYSQCIDQFYIVTQVIPLGINTSASEPGEGGGGRGD